MRWMFVLALVLAPVLAGCADGGSVAPAASDAAGKQFAPVPGRGVLYVYRPARLVADAVTLNVALDGRIAGSLGPDTWMRLELAPGRHELRCLAENTAVLPVDLVAGGMSFVAATSGFGLAGARCGLASVEESRGRQSVLGGRRVIEAP